MYKKDENVNLNLLNQDIKNKEIKPLYYFYGEETYLLRKYIQSIKKILKEENISIIEYDKDTYEDNKFYDNLNEQSLMGTRKLIILDNLKFTNRNFSLGIIKAMLDSIDDNFIIFIDYETENKYSSKYVFRKIDDVNDLMNVRDEDVKKKDKVQYLLNVVSTYGRLVDFKKLDNSEVKKHINTYLKKQNKTMDNFNIGYFLELTGLNLSTVFNELDKLVNYVGDKEKIEKTDIDKVVTKIPTEEVFKFIDAINQNNKSLAIKLYSDLMIKNVPYRMIFYLIKDNYVNLLNVKDKMQNGMSAQNIAAETKIPEWRVNKYVNFATNMEEDFIIDKLNKINTIDYEFMNGDIAQNFLVELFI